LATLVSVSAWAAMPSAGEPAVRERAAAPSSRTSATPLPASNQTDALVHLHRAATGAYLPAHFIVDASVRCCESARAVR
jgi:uncharacterized membrane protein